MQYAIVVFMWKRQLYQNKKVLISWLCCSPIVKLVNRKTSKHLVTELQGSLTFLHSLRMCKQQKNVLVYRKTYYTSVRMWSSWSVGKNKKKHIYRSADALTSHFNSEILHCPSCVNRIEIEYLQAQERKHVSSINVFKPLTFLTRKKKRSTYGTQIIVSYWRTLANENCVAVKYIRVLMKKIEPSEKTKKHFAKGPAC